MPLPTRAIPPIAAPPPRMPSRRRYATDTLEVVFSTTGDLIRIHSHGTRCSATWDAALAYGRLESECGDGTAVPIHPDEGVWLDGIRNLAAGWRAAVEAADRSWISWMATRIQRYDDRSDGLVDLVVVRPLAPVT